MFTSWTLEEILYDRTDVTYTRRLEWLESRSVGSDDIILNAVLSSLSDDHISLLEEHSVLLEHGFSEEDAAVMMGNRYPDALKAAGIFREGMKMSIPECIHRGYRRRRLESNTPGMMRCRIRCRLLDGCGEVTGVGCSGEDL